MTSVYAKNKVFRVRIGSGVPKIYPFGVQEGRFHPAYLVFPILQWTAWFLAVRAPQILPLMLWILVSSFFHSFTVHVSIHEWIHQYRLRSRWGDLWASGLGSLSLGLPLEGYVYHHWNHHTQCNSLDDFSSTWVRDGDQVRPQNLWLYALTWYRQTLRARDAFNQQLIESPSMAQRNRVLEGEKNFILLVCLLMACFGIKFLLLYFVMVYGGWFFTALHNYGQHPPVGNHSHVESYEGRISNFLTLNNGLHREHHEQPRLPTRQLRSQAIRPRGWSGSFTWKALRESSRPLENDHVPNQH
jgi:fatty acid desaturase